jgi:FkbM family methyltransferase
VRLCKCLRRRGTLRELVERATRAAVVSLWLQRLVFGDDAMGDAIEKSQQTGRRREITLRSLLKGVLKAGLAPLGLELRRHSTGSQRRATLAAAVQRLRAVGFVPATVFDVGAADGTPGLYDVFNDSRHILIEPLREFEPDLRRIVKNLPNAEYIAAAASSTSGRLVLHIGPHLDLTSTYKISNPKYSATVDREVPCVTIDQIWRDRDLRGPALLKVDVEGQELEVLRGANESLAHCEYILLEVTIYDLYTGAPRMEDIVGYLAGLGFLLNDILDYMYDLSGNLTTVDVAFVRKQSRLAYLISNYRA